MTAAQRDEKPDYGLDAPSVVRNLCLAGGAGILIWALGAAGAIPNGLTLGPVRIELGLAPLCAGVSMLGVGLWMLWSSKVGKFRHREKLLDHHAWRGDEQVLDVGCGRGLMLVGSARRLTTGMATGIDIWQAEDLSGNVPGAALENARREGVADRVAVRTADMRAMPFPDGTFDVVVSRVAIHNIYEASERVKAIHEIARVLKPGGEAIIEDIRHDGQYVDAFRERGCGEISRLSSRLVSGLWGVVTVGSFRPMVLRVRKRAAEAGQRCKDAAHASWERPA